MHKIVKFEMLRFANLKKTKRFKFTTFSVFESYAVGRLTLERSRIIYFRWRKLGANNTLPLLFHYEFYGHSLSLFNQAYF